MSVNAGKAENDRGREKRDKKISLSLDWISKVHGISKMVVLDLVRSQELMACLSYFLQFSARFFSLFLLHSQVIVIVSH